VIIVRKEIILGNKKVLTQKEKNNEEYYNHTKPIVECPYCHSTNTVKISDLSKVGYFALFGIFSLSRNSKQWHCNECGSDF